MALSDQIKVPAQVKGAVGGGGGSLSASDIPDHSADKLTSGTVAAARLPGVLANVDTQAELLAAAAGQPAATGTPNGSKYLRDDNSWQAISVPDTLTSSGNSSSRKLCGGASSGTTNPEIEVYGPSHASSPGAIESKCGGVTRASNGTWTPIYSLSKGTHNGYFTIYGSGMPGGAKYKINNTSIAMVVDETGTGAFGTTTGASLVALRVNSGNLEINVGTSFAASTKFGVRYEGIVV